MRMNWNLLLNHDRFRSHSIPLSELDGRDEFENDYSRVVFSSALRRLQDKSQVFPYDKCDFVRTRLTHSLEVSAIGRSLGASIENELGKKEEADFIKTHKGKIGNIMATLGLLHDLGNPPFGHFGEKTIQQYFKEKFSKDPYSSLTEGEKKDFLNFEGNAQCFRLMTRLQYLIDENGFNLTFGTLASSLKYPCSSLEINDKSVSLKKIGYFQSEEEKFKKVEYETGISNHRHPLAFILEAADDIAYSAADIEDGLKKKIINLEIVQNVFKKALDIGNDKEKELFKSLEIFRNKINKDYKEKDEIAVQFFRIKAQAFMIESVVKAFMENYNEIMNGSFDKELLEVSEAKRVRQAFKRLASDYVFQDKSILTRELVGGKAIRGLLEFFVDSVLKGNRKKSKTREGKLYNLISDNYRFICENYPHRRKNEATSSIYDRLLLVTDFVCGMTDTYALDLFQTLSGMRL